jgi:hypothetical protein
METNNRFVGDELSASHCRAEVAQHATERGFGPSSFIPVAR